MINKRSFSDAVMVILFICFRLNYMRKFSN